MADVHEKSGVTDENEFTGVKYKSFFLVGHGSYNTFNIEKFTGQDRGFSRKSMYISLGYARITSSSFTALMLFRLNDKILIRVFLPFRQEHASDSC